MGCFGGPTTTTTSNQNYNQATAGQQNQLQYGQNTTSGSTSGSQTTTPNMPWYLQQMYQSIPGQYNPLLEQLKQQSQQPLYGAPQQANYQQGLNRELGQAGQNINEQLARSGALNSNRSAEAQTNLALGGAQQMGNYLAQVPLLNRQAQSTAEGQYGNTLANEQNFRPPIGQTTDTSQVQNLINSMLQAGSSSGTSDTSGSSSGTSTQQQSGGLMQSLLGGLLNAGFGALTGGLSNIMGGGSFFNPNQGGNQAPVSTAPTPSVYPSTTTMPWTPGIGAGMAPAIQPSYGYGGSLNPYFGQMAPPSY